MNVNELWGKGWSLKPEQDPRTMECLGTIIRSGTRFTYYKDEQGGIWFEDEPEDEKAEISKAEEIDETPEAAPESEEVTEVLETPETPETPEEAEETAVEE